MVDDVPSWCADRPADTREPDSGKKTHKVHQVACTISCISLQGKKMLSTVVILV